jgi:uncharacterized repeat protein (TIGR01451 family)
MKTKALALTFALFLTVQCFILGQGGIVEPRGLRLKCADASPGYTLFTPMSSTMTYLINPDGQVVRTWRSAYLPSAWVYLLDNGHVLRGASDRGTAPFSGGGQGGRFQEFDFDGNLVWDFRYNETRLPHHDVAILPNGNVLAIAWESKTAADARRVGRRPAAVSPGGIWPDMLIEFAPQRPDSATIVWEWHIWDHLIQNLDPTLENYSEPSAHPERIDINADDGGPAFSRDVFHTNAVVYNAELDQILVSVPTFNEVWVIDHSTSTFEAAGHTGGRYGKGGDLLYRWGNPRTYGRGTAADQLLGFQHDARWIPPGRPGAGHMTVFSNRSPAPTGAATKVFEFVPPVDAAGNYAGGDSAAFGPSAPLWTYSNPSVQTTNLSGAERLENGNTLISSGPQGRVLEVTPAGNIVWEYWSPYAGPTGGSGNVFSLFRATKIRPDHPGLAGRDLRPMDPQPPISPYASVGSLPGGGQCVEPPPPPPTLTDIQPASGVQGTSVDVALTGTNFVSPTVTASGDGVAVRNVKLDADDSVNATFAIASDAAPGVRNITLTTPGGTSTAASFTILPPPPTLTKVTPGIGARGATGSLDVTLSGTNFVPGLVLDGGSKISVTDVQVVSSTEATAKLVVAPGASLGPADIRVTTTGGSSNALPFTITDPFPDLSIVSSHTGNFGVGFNEIYTVTIWNAGSAPTSGTITVTDSIPAGFTFVSAAGSGWACSASSQVLTCTTSTVLAINDSTRYLLTVAVNGGAPRVTHSAAVALDGDLNPANNTTADATSVVMPSPVFAFTPDPLVPGQQATVDVFMPAPFPHDVTGSILLTFTSTAVNPADDPAIQFASGGRTATFTIPANETQARFGSDSRRGPLAFQSGTVAGTLAFSGSVTAGTMRANFSRSGPDALAIPLHAPSIERIQTSTDGGFSASMLLFSTAREVTQLSLAFNTSPTVRLSCGSLLGCTTSGNVLNLDVASLFTDFFNRDSTVGGLALFRLPLSIQGGAVKGTVTVTFKNTKGQSNPQSFALP